jgi:CubicO group peptidase (beta-lactamase class C family)
MGRLPPATRESIDMPSGTRYVVRSPAVVHESIDGEAVIINLESGAYFSADGAGAVAWQRIAGGASPADLAMVLAERYGDDTGVTKRTDLARSVGTDGWDGGFGTSWYADPKEDLTAVLMTQQAWTSPDPPNVCRDFWTSVYAAVED